MGTTQKSNRKREDDDMALVFLYNRCNA